MTTTKKKAPKKIEEKSVDNASIAYSTRYGSYDGSVLDGMGIARNNAQFYKMYRVNTDIRRAIKEKQETSMKNGYEIQQTIESTGNKKTVKAPEFEWVMERSGGINVLKNKIVKELDIFGYTFIRRVYNARNIKNYEVLDPRYVSVVTDADLVPIRYIYKNPIRKGKQENYDAADIIVFMEDEDMDNPVFGISCLETIVIDVLGDEEASLSNHAYFKNDGIPSALYVLQAGLTGDQQKQVYEQIQETLRGGHNKHKSIASSAVTDVKTITAGHTDMSFDNQRKAATNKVCVAMGVPRTILGYVEDVNHSNWDSQYTKFIENTIRPLERRLSVIFNTFLHDWPEYEKLEFVIIDEHIDDYEQRCKLARDNVASGLWTINRALDYIGDEASDDEMANEHIVSSNTRLLSDLVNGSNPEPIGTATNANPSSAKNAPVRIKLVSSKN